MLNDKQPRMLECFQGNEMEVSKRPLMTSGKTVLLFHTEQDNDIGNLKDKI